MIPIEERWCQNTYIKVLDKGLASSVKKLKLAPNVVFLQDNDPVHTGRIVQTLLKKKKIKLVKLRPTSPDLNVIENLWHGGRLL